MAYRFKRVKEQDRERRKREKEREKRERQKSETKRQRERNRRYMESKDIYRTKTYIAHEVRRLNAHLYI